MKLLSLVINYHDTNISYFDGEKLHYYKHERYSQVKHDLINTKNELDFILNHFWNITLDDMDDICFVNKHPKLNSKLQSLTGDWSNTHFKNIHLIDHHTGHSLSASLFSPADVSIVIDGRGGDSVWTVETESYSKTGMAQNVGSIGEGMIYAAKELGLTGHPLDLSGKLMGLQSYGTINQQLMDVLSQYDINQIGISLNREGFHITDQLFSPSHRVGISDMDWIRTLHQRCGEIILDFFKEHANPTDTINYSGGVAQNVIWNTELKKHFPKLNILPHVSDEGLSLGGMEYLRKFYDLPKMIPDGFPFCQTDISPDEVNYDTIKVAAKHLSEGKIVAWYQGHGEIGPRALGNRSLLMDPRLQDGKKIMNEVKNREYFRPFGASVLDEFKKEYFDLDFENPYMLYVGKCLKEDMQAITHVDGTSRVQTVKTGSFRTLLEEFYKLTGCPVLLNTSLNVSGRPIAGSTDDAFEEFKNKKIDVLIVGNKIFETH